MEIRRLPILRVVQVGNDDFNRYQIADEQEQIWNGNRFRPKGGVLYADHNVAATDVHKILKKNFEGVKPVRYLVPVFVELFSSEPVTMNDVALYLSTVSRLYVNTPDHGHGPGDSLVNSWIEWSRIKQIKEISNE